MQLAPIWRLLGTCAFACTTITLVHAVEKSGLNSTVRAKIESVQLDDEIKAQVDKIDALTLETLPEQYRNKGYLEQMAKTMFEKALDSYKRGIGLRSIGSDSDAPLPSKGQAGALFQAAKLYLHGGIKYVELAVQL